MSAPSLPGKRHSRQRDVVYDVLRDAAGPLRPGEVLDMAGARSPGIGQATVYRALRALTEGGVIRPVGLRDGEVGYEPTGTRHHHHFRCRVCDLVRCVDVCPEGLPREIPGGYRVEDHEITFVGVCPDCRDGVDR